MFKLPQIDMTIEGPKRARSSSPMGRVKQEFSEATNAAFIALFKSRNCLETIDLTGHADALSEKLLNSLFDNDPSNSFIGRLHAGDSKEIRFDYSSFDRVMNVLVQRNLTERLCDMGFDAYSPDNHGVVVVQHKTPGVMTVPEAEALAARNLPNTAAYPNGFSLPLERGTYRPKYR